MAITYDGEPLFQWDTGRTVEVTTATGAGASVTYGATPGTTRIG